MDNFIIGMYDIANIFIRFAIVFLLVEITQYLRVLRAKKIMELNKDHES